jgi:hypothetical protein
MWTQSLLPNVRSCHQDQEMWTLWSISQDSTSSPEGELGTHVLRWCECGLVELPKFSKKSGRHFFACPAWSPMSRKRKRVQIGEEIDVDNGSTVPEDTKYCGSFANVSNKQNKTLNLTAIPMGVNRHAE